MKKTHFRYEEDVILADILQYIDKTYGQHYVRRDNTQLMDSVFADGEAIPACRFNVQKYVRRFGKKDGENIGDLYKAAHYLVFMIHAARLKNKKPAKKKIAKKVVKKGKDNNASAYPG